MSSITLPNVTCPGAGGQAFYYEGFFVPLIL